MMTTFKLFAKTDLPYKFSGQQSYKLSYVLYSFGASSKTLSASQAFA